MIRFGLHFKLKYSRVKKYIEMTETDVQYRRKPKINQVNQLLLNRIVEKSGEKNIKYIDIPKHGYKYLKDIVTTLIEEQWRYTLSVLFLSFFAFWIIFAGLWYFQSYLHGDFEIANLMDDTFEPCIVNAHNFAGYIVYVVDMQTTIGYGGSYPSENCPGSLYLMGATMIVGILLQCAIVGIFYSKMMHTFRGYGGDKFSKRAVV